MLNYLPFSEVMFEYSNKIFLAIARLCIKGLLKTLL